MTGTLTGSTGVMNIGSGQLYKDASGNVGIGQTPTGSYKLEVNGNMAGGFLNVFGTGTPANGINNVTTNALGFFTNSTERARIDTSGNWYMNSGYGSIAVAYGCRAWVSYNGVTPAVNASGNISSVTRNSTGDYTLNFTNSMPDTNYCMGGMIGDIAGGSVNARILTSGITSAPTLMSTTQVRMATYASNNIYTFNAFVVR